MRTAALVMPYFLWLGLGRRFQLAGEERTEVDDDLANLYSAEFQQSRPSGGSGVSNPLKAFAVLLSAYQGPATEFRLAGHARKPAIHNLGCRKLHPPGFAGSSRAAVLALCACQRAPSDLSDQELKDELTARGFKWRAELEGKLAELRTSQGPVPPATDEAKTSTDASSCSKPPASDVAAPSPALDDLDAQIAMADPDELYRIAYQAACKKTKLMDLDELCTELTKRGARWADLGNDRPALWMRLGKLMAEASLFSKSGALMPGVAMQVTGAQLREEMADRGTPLLVDVFATWCGPCQMMAPKLDEVAKKAGGRLRVAKLDSDAESQLSAELRVTSFPTVIFMQNGQEVYRLQGVPEQEGALEALVAQHLRLKL